MELKGTHFEARCYIRHYRLMYAILYTLLLVGIVTCVPQRCSAHEIRYVLQKRTIGEYATQLKLYDRQVQRTVWTATVTDVYGFAWSPNHKAIAIALRRGTTGRDSFRLCLLSWRTGYKPKLAKLGWSDSADGVLDFAWSTDNRHVAFRSWASGDLSLNDGSLWCLDINKARISAPYSGGVRKMKWVNRNRLRYWKALVIGIDGSSTNPLRMITSHKYCDWQVED
jgi:dipeptidyl aminopeptidase/acylaminoacyl peptidase